MDDSETCDRYQLNSPARGAAEQVRKVSQTSLGMGGGQNPVEHGQKCCMKSDPTVVELMYDPCTHCCCPAEEADRWIYLPCVHQKSQVLASAASIFTPFLRFV